jgi:hypothetical protein
MILITTGFTGLCVQKRHEFGHESLPKIIQVDLIFFTIFIFGRHGRFFDFMRTYFREWGAPAIPQYRQQVKAIKSKVRAQERKYSDQRIKNLESDLKKYMDKYHDLERKTVDLKNLAYQVRNIKKLDDDFLNNL